MISKKQLFIFVLAIGNLLTAQVVGNITNTKNEPLSFVNIFIENTYNGTTSNEDGFYELNISEPKTYTIVYSFLGFKTVKKQISINSFPFTLDIVLEETSVSLNEVLINSEINQADIVMRKAIATRQNNLEKINSYKANFYSRGLIKIKDAPKKILGQDIDLPGLDSTRSGIFYLSETLSKIQYLRPDKLKETITASKVSGDNTGFSFNNAIDVDYNFYNNTIPFGNAIISPIANNAFNYYNFKLEGTFYDARNTLINKIKVTPKRKNDPVFEGYIYIVEDQWNIFALELDITGVQARIPIAEKITLKQTFSYSEADAIWALISQSLDFGYSMFGIKGEGRFTAVYSNYSFNKTLTAKDFDKEIVAFEANANKKDSLFWNKIRPVPLTKEEQTDYKIKDSIQIIRDSKTYKDSVDAVINKFKIGAILSGYTYSNSFKNWSAGIESPLKAVNFNTVQGWHANINSFYTKNYDDFNRYFKANANLQYGFSDKRLRATGTFTYKFNNINRPYLIVSGGADVQQYNSTNPITPVGNTIASLYFEENYMKLYERRFIALNYSEELFNGFRFYTNVSYENRQALFNTTDQTFYPKENKTYTSNNPLDINSTDAPFENHNIVKLNVSGRFNFGQTYLSYPNSKFNVTTDKYPTLILSYEKGFGATIKDYNFDQIKARLYQSSNIANKGRLSYNLRAGKFFNAKAIAFMDFQHFNGNQINVSRRGNYTDVFNNLGYYDLSTNDRYLEAHTEHDFNGFILGKIPLLNKLNFNLVVGAHALLTPNNKTYQEYSIGIDNVGWGKFRFLRVDYIRSYQSGFLSDALVFGLKLF